MNSRFSEEFRSQAVVKALQREPHETLGMVAEELNVGYSTLQKWLRISREQGMSKKQSGKRPQDWTAERKFQALVDTSGLEGEALSAYCRGHGLFAHQLKQWKDDLLAAQTKADPREELRRLKAENKQLQRELHCKDKALAETTALLVLKKKVDRLLGEGEDD